MQAGFEVAVLYLRDGRGGRVRFLHTRAEGAIEQYGSNSMGTTFGTRFEIEFASGRNVSFLLPYRYEDTPVPADVAVFTKSHTAVAPTKKYVPRRTRTGESLN